jgi:cytochrome c-type biogenesis protein CcmH/NrfG
VARGTQHRKRRPTANARAAAVAAPTKRKQKPPQWQEELFFARLRTHAKWVFLALALVFALGFVFFGVGSGSTGISDALQNFFSSNSAGGTSISSLKNKADKHPQDPTAWRNLATAYEQKQDTSNAVTALERYTALRPHDQNALGELASQYTTLAQNYANDYTNAQNEAALNAPSTLFQPAASTPFGKAFQDPTALQDPIDNAAQTAASAKENTAYTGFLSAQKKAETAFQKLAKLNPTDASTQLQLGAAAQASNDTKTAIAAYKKFLKLAPHDSQAASVRQRLKQLSPSSHG